MFFTLKIKKEVKKITMTSEDHFLNAMLSFERNHVVPAIIRKVNEDRAEWIYSDSQVELLKGLCFVKFSKRSERVSVMKKIIDLYSSGHIGVLVVHAAIICLWIVDHYSAELNGLTERNIGQKRLQIFSSIPEIRILTDDDFLTYQLQLLRRIEGVDN